MPHQTEQRIAAAGIQAVAINGRDGDVTVIWTSTGEITVRGEGVEIQQDDSALVVEQDPREGFLGLLGTKAIEVELPETIANVQVSARRGDLRLEGPHGTVTAKLDHGEFLARGGSGDLSLRLGAGDSRVERYVGAVSLQTGAGDVVLIDIDGPLSLQSGAGDVVVRRGRGDLNLKSGAGDCVVSERACDELSVKTGAGDVSINNGSTQHLSIQNALGDIDCTAALGLGSHSIASGAGDVSLGIPRDLAARIEVVTVNGDVESDVPLVAVGKRGPRSLFGRRLVGSIGEGEPRAEITVRTGKGDIALRWLSAAAVPAALPLAAPPAPTPPSPPTAAVPTNGAGRAPSTDRQAPSPLTRPATGSGHAGDEERVILAELAAGALTVEEAGYLLDALAKRTA